MPYSREVVVQIADKHGLPGPIELMPKGGLVNEAWSIGDYVLRICVEPEGKDEAAREAAIVPLVIEAGVRAPRLVAFDLEPDLTELPYTVYERAEGNLLGYCDFEPEKLSRCYREIGREIARLGRTKVEDPARSLLRDGRAMEPWKVLAKALSRKLIEPDVGKEIVCWLEFMEPLQKWDESYLLIHMDIHPWNVFIDTDRDELTAIIDWGDASWGDPAFEFASMPLACMPTMLEGYAEEGGMLDEKFVARALYAGLSLSLWEIRELDTTDFDRRWWRMPTGGWGEFKDIVTRRWPDFARFEKA